MTPNRLQLTAFSLLMACDEKVRTAQEYALECESILGPFPEFRFDAAIEIPMTKNGVPLTHESDNPNNCDHPFAFNGACETGNRLGRHYGSHSDGTKNRDVVFVTFFRGVGLGVIGHKFSTGHTCFLEIDDLGNPQNAVIPTPEDDNYNDFWTPPYLLAEDFNCVNCHMASPFLHTPAVDQLRDPNDTSDLLLPQTGLAPYILVGQEWQKPHTTDIQNSCSSCHRAQCTSHFQNYPLDALEMPPPFQDASHFDHSDISDADRQEIREWCNTLDLDYF